MFPRTGTPDPMLGQPARPSVETIRQWYQEIAVLLNWLENSGEELALTDNGRQMEIRGLTSRVLKRHPETRGTWSRE